MLKIILVILGCVCLAVEAFTLLPNPRVKWWALGALFFAVAVFLA